MQRIKPRKAEFSAVLDIVLVLIVLVFLSFLNYGVRVLTVVSISVAASIATDVFCVFLRKDKYDYKDLSAVASGLILALMMPASVPYGILIIANVVSIAIGKQIFGGKNNIIFTCAAVGFIFSAFCWQGDILMYPRPLEELGVASNVTNTLYPSFTQTLNIATSPAVSDIDIILGRYIGPMGTTHIIVLIVSAVVLMFRRSISALTFCSGLTTIAVLTYIFPKFGTSPISSVYYECISGMTIFGLIFLACDYFTMPKTRSSRFLYGVIIGVITVVFRHIGTVENPIVFAVLLANPIRISLDRSTISFSKTADELLEKFKTWFANKKYLRDNPPHKPMPIIKPSKALIQQPKFKFSLKFNVDKSKKNGFFKSTHERKNKSDDKPKQ